MKSFFSLLVVLTSGWMLSAQNVIVYSNITTFQNGAFNNDFAADINGNTITTMVADDITITDSSAFGEKIFSFVFSVFNFNAATISARPLVRFYDDNGTGGLPGTFLGGVDFDPVSFANGGVLLNSGDITASNIIIPGDGTFWAGMTFDNNNGATGATDAQLNNLAQGIFDPPTIGSSADVFFWTNDAGSFEGDNPAGSDFFFGGDPVANFAWQFTAAIPEPSTYALFALGFAVVGGAAYWRRKRMLQLNNTSLDVADESAE